MTRRPEFVSFMWEEGRDGTELVIYGSTISLVLVLWHTGWFGWLIVATAAALILAGVCRWARDWDLVMQRFLYVSVCEPMHHPDLDLVDAGLMTEDERLDRAWDRAYERSHGDVERMLAGVSYKTYSQNPLWKLACRIGSQLSS